MAAEYIAAIRQIRPHGPYHLAGWSLGGVLAFEMARQLARQGEATGLLGILDTPAPITVESKPQPLLAAVKEYLQATRIVLAMTLASIPHIVNGLYLLAASAFRRRQAGAKPPSLRERIRWLWLRAWHARLLKQAGIAEYVDANSDLLLIELPALQRVLRALRHHLELAAHYVPETYEGRVVLFRAKLSLGGSAVKDPAMGWPRLVSGGVEVVSVPGNHVAMLSEPYVRDFAQALTKSLQQIEDQIL
jgi:thioesterase domain-containing protein